ncbi:MAG: ATP-dependent helicase HrpB, partial [Oceanospirillaceae bacterium]
SEWLVVADCDAQKKEGRIYTAAAINMVEIESVLGAKFSQQELFDYDKEKQKITGRAITQYGAIRLKSVIIARIPDDKLQQCLLQVLNKTGLTLLNWTTECENWLCRAQWLGAQIASFKQLSKAWLVDNIEQWLVPYLTKVKSIAQLKQLKLAPILLNILSWQEQQLLDREAPTHYKTPSQKKITITYDSIQGPTVAVVLQEMFGEIQSPRIAAGTVPLRFELLSPARRPIQTTSDLENFWNSSYFAVAKDMRGQYPKHRWPEKPLLEKAGKSIKAKR